jgi:hypothetical protein
MYYVIEGVRWSPRGTISHVLWYPVRVRDDDIEHGEAELVPVVDAAQACHESEVRVYVDEGRTGSYFTMKACPEGLEADSEPSGQPLRERLAHLPTV